MNHEYVRYNIQHRRGAANALEGVFLHENDKGEMKEKHEIIFLCTLHKKEGDKWIDELYDDLTSKLAQKEK